MRALFIFFILILSACTKIPGSKPSTKAQAEKNSTSIITRSTDSPKTTFTPLLQYAREFNDMSASAQKSELLSLNTKNKNDTRNRTKTALIYALPNSSLHDDNKALALLDNANEDSTLSAEDAYLLKILSTYVQERIKTQQKIIDEQKRSESYKQKNEALQAQVKLLEQKLEALKNIEKNMVNRDQGAH